LRFFSRENATNSFFFLIFLFFSFVYNVILCCVIYVYSDLKKMNSFIRKRNSDDDNSDFGRRTHQTSTARSGSFYRERDREHERDRDKERERDWSKNRDYDRNRERFIDSYRGARDSDDEKSNRMNYRTPRRFSSDEEDKGRILSARSRPRVLHSESEDSDTERRKFDTQSRREFQGLHDRPQVELSNKIKTMIQYDRNICEQLQELDQIKMAKQKKIDQLKEDIHRDTIKEQSLYKKLSEIRMNRKLLQSRLDRLK
jgi:hypothetical protein